MPNSKIILTKTSRPNATPHPNDLDFGELAINYEDGLLFFKNSSGRISKIASSGSFTTLTKHVADRENPHNVNKAQVGLEFADNSSDLDKPISNATQNALNDKVNSTHLTSNYYNKGATDTQIQNKFNSIVVNISAPSSFSPNGSLTYQKSNNTFNYTQPTIPTLSDLGGVGIDDISVDEADPSLGRGTLSYGGSGRFIYDQPTIGGLGGYAKTEIGLNYKDNGATDGSLTYNDGFFLYDQPTIGGLTQGKITLTAGVLDVDGFVTDAELAQVVQKEGQDVSSLQEQINSNDVDIAELREDVNSNDVDIAALQQKDVALQAQIDANDTDNEELRALIVNNDNSDDISDLSERISTNDGELSTIRGRIVDSEADITALQQKDANLQGQINNKVTNLGAVTGIQQLTQEAYNLLTPDASTVYIIVG